MGFFDNLYSGITGSDLDTNLAAQLGLEDFDTGGKYHDYYEIVEDATKQTVIDNSAENLQKQREAETQKLNENSNPNYTKPIISGVENNKLIMIVIGVLAGVGILISLVRK